MKKTIFAILMTPFFLLMAASAHAGVQNLTFDVEGMG